MKFKEFIQIAKSIFKAQQLKNKTGKIAGFEMILGVVISIAVLVALVGNIFSSSTGLNNLTGQGVPSWVQGVALIIAAAGLLGLLYELFHKKGK